MEKCAAASAHLAADAVCEELHAKEDQQADRRAIDAKIARLEERCAVLEREYRGEVHAVRADSTASEWILENFDKLYGQQSVQYEQEFALRLFPLSDKRIREPALQQIYHWKERYEVYQPGKTPEEEQILRNARARLDKEPGAHGKRQLNELLLRLALLSGSRKATWCQIIADRNSIDVRAKSYAAGGKNDPRGEGSLLAAIDRALKTVEHLRRLHWQELDLLRDKAGDLQRGAFDLSIQSQAKAKSNAAQVDAEILKNNAIQEYLFSEILSLHKTFTGRQGFNNRCIEVLDHIRKTLLVQRSQECVSRELREWEEEKTKQTALDEYKRTIMTWELEKGAECGVFVSDAIPLLLY